MPRYFFNVLDGENRPDPDGEELADDEAARRSAVAVIFETLREHSAYVVKGGPFSVVVTNGVGQEIWRLTVQGR
ncbi:hypothetical protein [Brevundimonas sp. NIBR11]|uniref:DUF6894 family protein n=1 Tax=Brevundimonas sp. NIBR11 TaxID=3015999 RepID=UPI0022F027AC|nr:hypothetical protein [Brevundimonas sp. NIBR11]WGM31525.1 hypothetical protein KKHFBJBL_01772 [Brevundimonas sp. NIBR11]